MRRANVPLLSLLSVLGAMLAGGCGGASHSGRELTLYNGQHEQTTALLVAAFEKQTGVKVNVRSGDEATLGNQILQEGSSSPADVFYTENTPVLEALREHGLLAPVAAATLAAVPSRYDSAQGDWVAVSARVSTLVYNTRQLTAAQLPSSIVKLAGTATAERWLAGMQANGRIYPDNETVVTQVNNGESAVGPINHYYWYRLRDELGAGG